jgi:hypothetical protein
MGIFKCKIRSWRLPHLLLMTALILLMNIIINTYNYYISNKVLLEECDKVENMGITGAAATFCLKRRF